VMTFDVAVTMLSPASGVRREANGEQAGIRETPPLRGCPPILSGAYRTRSNEETLRNTSTVSIESITYASVANAPTNERCRANSNLRVKR
jgi:hypothetical protein